MVMKEMNGLRKEETLQIISGVLSKTSQIDNSIIVLVGGLSNKVKKVVCRYRTSTMKTLK